MRTSSGGTSSRDLTIGQGEGGECHRRRGPIHLIHQRPNEAIKYTVFSGADGHLDRNRNFELLRLES